MRKVPSMPLSGIQFPCVFTDKNISNNADHQKNDHHKHLYFLLFHSLFLSPYHKDYNSSGQ